MNLNDLKGQRAAYYEEFVEIGQTVDAEGRALTEAEQERADKLDDRSRQPMPKSSTKSVNRTW